MPYRRFGWPPGPRHVGTVAVWLELIAVEVYAGELYFVLRYVTLRNHTIYYASRVSYAYYWDLD